MTEALTGIPADFGATLDAALPLALLPVRLETRWGRRDLVDPGGEEPAAEMPVLRVRIFPDDISVVAVPEGLTADEAAAGGDFWEAYGRPPQPDEATDPGLREHRRRAAWGVLVRTVGSARAAHVARSTRDRAAPTDGNGDRPAARLLPEAWVVVGYSGGERVVTAYVPGVLETIAVGPPGGLDRPGLLDKDDAHLVVDPDLRWLTDFSAAERQGMAVTIDLATLDQARARERPAWLQRGLDSLVVFGLRNRQAADPEGEARQLADLVASHHAAGETGFVPVGTPTNNLGDQPAGWSSARDVFEDYDQVVAGRAAPAAVTAGALRGEPGTTAAGALAAALGVPPAVLADLPHADDQGLHHARAIATALFPATIGEAIRRLSAPAVDVTAERVGMLDGVARFAADHVADYVRGRGPLPVLRVGRQPYGVLPITLARRLVIAPTDPPGVAVLNGLLGTLRSFWVDAAGRVPLLGRPGDPAGSEGPRLLRVLQQAAVPHAGQYHLQTFRVEEPALEATTAAILGPLVEPVADLQLLATPTPAPASNPYTARIVAHDDVLGVIGDFAVREQVALDVQAVGVRNTLAELLKWAVAPGDGPADPRTLGEALTPSWPRLWYAPVAETVDSTQEPSTPARYLAELAAGNTAAAPSPAPPDLLYHLIHASLVLSAPPVDPTQLAPLWNRYLGQFRERHAALGPRISQYGDWIRAAGVTPINQGPVLLASPASIVWPNLHRDPADLLPWYTLPDPPPFSAGAPAAETVAAVRSLAEARLADHDYARLVGETLACASTRLDAWITSLATRRLDDLRAARPTGVQLGCWGLVTHLRWQEPVLESGPPGWRAPDGSSEVRVADPQVGSVHAPSLAHATTAGVLRAAERAHGEGQSTLSELDLTSRQARLGREVLQAVGNGQPLGAVLGDHLERALGDADLYISITVLRDRFPQHRPADEPVPGISGGVPTDVVDGLDAWRAWRASPSAITALEGGARLDDVFTELHQVVEAIADTLVAEGVHALVSGRTELAGATFVALEEGAEPPLDLDVLRTPRSGVTLTHRLLLPLDTVEGTAGWERSRPRAELAPEAERWAESMLAEPSGYRFTVVGLDANGAERRADVGLAELGLCALDVVAEAAPTGDGGSPALEQRLGTAAGIVARRTVDDHDGRWGELVALAGAMGTVLAGARPVLPADLSPPPTGDAPDAVPAVIDAAGDLATRVAAQRATLRAAIEEVRNPAITDQYDDIPVADAVLQPFAGLGLPGTVVAPGAATVGAARAGAAAAEALLHDLDRLLREVEEAWAKVRGQPVPDADDAAWTERLRSVALADRGVSVLVAMTRRLGGDAVVPAPPVPSELHRHLLAVASPSSPSSLDLEAWLERAGRVRDRAAAYDDLRLYADALARPSPPLQAAHLPLVADQPWLGGLIDPAARATLERPERGHARTHLVVAGTVPEGAGSLSGLVLDEFDEVLPSPTATTGLAFHYDAPSARPPQSLLLAIHPDPAGKWSWELVDEIVHEALGLARLRLVELEDLAPTGIDQLLPLAYIPAAVPRDDFDAWPPPTQPGFDVPAVVDDLIDLTLTMPADLARFILDGEMTEELAQRLFVEPWRCPDELLGDLRAAFWAQAEAAYPGDVVVATDGAEYHVAAELAPVQEAYTNLEAQLEAGGTGEPGVVPGDLDGQIQDFGVDDLAGLGDIDVRVSPEVFKANRLVIERGG